MGVDATLDYDSSVLEFTNYDNQLSGWTMVNDGMKFVLYGVDPISSSSVLSVTFRVKSNLDAGTALSASFKNITVSDGTAVEPGLVERQGGRPPQQQLRPGFSQLL